MVPTGLASRADPQAQSHDMETLDHLALHRIRQSRDLIHTPREVPQEVEEGGGVEVDTPWI